MAENLGSATHGSIPSMRIKCWLHLGPRGAVLGHHLGRRALASVEADVGATRLPVNDDGSKRCLDLARHFMQKLERLLSDEEHSLIVFGGDKEVDHTVVVAVIVSGDAENVQYAD